MSFITDGVKPSAPRFKTAADYDKKIEKPALEGMEKTAATLLPEKDQVTVESRLGEHQVDLKFGSDDARQTFLKAAHKDEALETHERPFLKR